MQHKKKVSLHRSTVWRQSVGCKKKSGIKGTGRGRRSKAQDDEALGLAAGIIDSLRESGACYAWQLKVFPRELVSYDSKTKRLVHSPSPDNQKTQLLSGSDETINAMKESGLPAGLWLYVTARIAEYTGSLKPRDSTAAKSHLRRSFQVSHLDNIAEQIVQAREDGKLKHQKDRQVNFNKETGDDDSAPPLCRLHRIEELQGCGLSKQTCWKWKNDRRAVDASKRAFELLGGIPYAEKRSTVYKV